MKVLLVANTSWFLYHFESALIGELRTRGHEVVTAAPDRRFEDALQRLGARHVTYSLEREGMAPLSEIRSLLQLLDTYRRERPDVILHNTIKPVIYGTLAGRVAHVPRVVNMIPGLGYVFTGTGLRHALLRRLVVRLYRVALASSSRVLFQNATDREYFIRDRIVTSAASGVTNGLGVDTERFAPGNPPARPGRVQFLMVSRVLADKGVREYVDAARLASRMNPAITCRLLGPMDPGNPTAIRKQELEVWVREGAIEYIPEVADVRPHVGDADAVVLPSYREGMPNAILEAMAMGKPVIATDVPGCRDAVVHEQTGLLVPPRDAAALAGAMVRLARSPEEREAMGRKGRARVVERYDVRLVNRIILAALGLAPDIPGDRNA